MVKAGIKLVFQFCCLLMPLCFSAQQVTVSPDISIRNNILYDIVGQVGDRILFYREKGNEREVLLYDDDLVFQSERQINLDEKRCSIYEVINLDSAFAVIYGYRKEGMDITKLDIFDNSAVRIDSVFLTNKEREWKGLNFETVQSDDESKIALYSILDSDKLQIITVDVTGRKVLSDSEYIFKGTDLYDEIVDIKLDNRGTFYLLAEHDNTRGNKENHVAHIYQLSREGDFIHDILIPLNDIVCQDLFFTINNLNNTIGIAGLYDEKRSDSSTGYFWLSGNKNTLDRLEFDLMPFEEDVFFEVYGERKKERMENFRISDVLWKSDGTPIIAFEVAYDISRRSGSALGLNQTSSYGRSSIPSASAYSDHYRDDMVLVSLDKNAEKEWHQVFYKKQFSQNDNGAFSSFYPFITPSRLRLIYNDQITNNSTVSEYILDGTGNYKRTSVLSTEYQNLRLRFPDAEQISSTELLVPSQKSYTVNIVKIDFTY